MRLLTFFDTAVEEGLIKPENRGLVQVARDASEALEIVEREWRFARRFRRRMRGWMSW